MFDHHQPLRRQIQHLAAFHRQGLYLAQVSLTVAAPVHWLDHHGIGGGRQQQGATWVTGLSTGPLAAALTSSSAVMSLLYSVPAWLASYLVLVNSDKVI
jgi:hypothetical protein